MPPPPNYDCPVCKKGFQRGYLAKHIYTHSQSDLIKEVINRDDILTKSAHPHFDCSGHIYIICPNIKHTGFELGTRLHKAHTCDHNYKDWLNISVSKKNSVKIESIEKTVVNQINMLLPDDEIQPEKNLKCKCITEITDLKNELEKLIKWKDLILSTVPKPKDQKSDDPKLVEPKPVESRPTEPKPVEPKPVETKPVEPKPTEPKPVKKATKPKIHASKKEIEKGMWCTLCQACGTTAQFSTDLRSCSNCNRMTHFNDDLTNCYHWDCVVCDKKSCYTCVKQAGGNKMKPLCSQACANIYKSTKY